MRMAPYLAATQDSFVKDLVDQRELSLLDEAAFSDLSQQRLLVDELHITALGVAVAIRWKEGVRRLVERGVDIDAPCVVKAFPAGRQAAHTPLATAIAEQAVDMVDLLAELGCSMMRPVRPLTGQGEVSPMRLAQMLTRKTPTSRAVGDWLRRHEACRRAALVLLAAHRFRQRRGRRGGGLPRDVFVVIGQYVWESRNEHVWKNIM